MARSTRLRRLRLGRILAALAIVALLGFGAYRFYRYQKAQNTLKLLEQANAAVAAEAWDSAAASYRLYLSRKPSDTTSLRAYMDLLMERVEPSPETVSDAARGLRRLIQRDPTDRLSLEQLTSLYLAIREYALAEGLAQRWLEADADSVSAALALASARRSLHHEEQSAHGLIEALQRMPKAAALYPPLVDLLTTSLHRPAEAQTWLKRGLAECPDAFEVHLAAFAYLGRSGDNEAAERHLATALAAAPDNPRVLMAAARYYVVNDRASDAQPSLDRLSELAPTGRSVLLLRSECAIKSGSTERMIVAGDALMANVSDNDAEFLAKAAELYVRARRFQAADEAIDKLAAVADRTEEQTTWLEILRGARALYEDRPYAAIPHLEQAIRRDPSHLWGTELLALAYTDVGATNEASDLYRRILVLAPQATATRRAMFRIAARSGQVADLCAPSNADAITASAPLTELIQIVCALETTPRDAVADRASEWTEKIERISSEIPQDDLAAGLIARGFVRLAQPDRAVAYAQRMVSAAQASSASVAPAGRALLAGGYLEPAIAVATLLTERFPDAADGYVLHAEALAEGEEWSDASEYIEASAAPDSVRGWMWRVVADARLRRGQNGPALEALRLAQSLRPEDIELLRAMARASSDMAEVDGAINAIRRLEGEDGLHWRYERAAALIRLDRSAPTATVAIPLLTDCLAARPGWVAARLLLGYAQETAGNDEAAANAYRTAMAHQPELGGGEVAFRLIEILKRLGQFAEADAVLDGLAGEQPDTPQMLKLLTERHLRHRKLDSAVATAERLLETQHEDPAWAALAADLYTRTGQPARALEIARAALAEHPTSVSVLRSMAAALIAEGRTDEGRRLVHDSADQQATALHHLLVAAVSVRLGEIEEAEAAVERALKIGKADATVHAVAADFWAMRGDRAKQLALVREAVSLRGEDPTHSLTVARLLAAGAADDRAEALAITDRRLTVDPADVSTLVLKAKLLAASDPPDLPEAESLLSTALRADRRSTEAHHGMALVQAQAGKLSEAEGTVAAGLALGPNDPDLLLASGEIHSFRGEYRDAITPLQRLLRLRPRMPRALRLLVTAYQQTQQVDRAIELLERSTEENDRTPLEMVMLARLREAGGELPRAEALFQQAWERDPSSSALFVEYVQYFARRADLDQVYALASQRHQRFPDDVDSMLVAGELLAAESRDARLRQTGSNWLSGIADRYPDRAADAIYRIAMSHYRQGDLVNAETMLLKATTLAPTAPQPTNALAWLYGQDRDRPREALGLIERFTQAGGTANAEMLDTHAAILLKLGRIDEARQKATECLNAAGQTPTLTAANYRMGLALLEQGDRDAAITYVRHALHLDEQLGGLTPTERSEARRILMP